LNESLTPGVGKKETLKGVSAHKEGGGQGILKQSDLRSHKGKEGNITGCLKGTPPNRQKKGARHRPEKGVSLSEKREVGLLKKEREKRM